MNNKCYHNVPRIIVNVNNIIRTTNEMTNSFIIPEFDISEENGMVYMCNVHTYIIAYVGCLICLIILAN